MTDEGSAKSETDHTPYHGKSTSSAQVISQAKDDPPMLVVRVISACYEVPAGETVEHY